MALLIIAVIVLLILILISKKGVVMKDPCPKYPNYGYLPNRVEMSLQEFANRVVNVISDPVLALIAIATGIQEHGRSGGKIRFYGNNWHGALFVVKKRPNGDCYSAWGDDYIGGKFYTNRGEWLIYFETLEDSIRFFEKHARRKLKTYIQKYGLKQPGQFSDVDFAEWYVRMWYAAEDINKALNEKGASLRAAWKKAVELYSNAPK